MTKGLRHVPGGLFFGPFRSIRFPSNTPVPGSHTYRAELEPSLYHGDAPDAVFVVGASPPQSVGVYRTVAVPAVIASLARSKRR